VILRPLFSSRRRRGEDPLERGGEAKRFRNEGDVIMNAVRSMLLAAVVLAVAAEAWGTEQDRFLASFKKYGVSDSFAEGKKPCLCVGGSENGMAGRLLIAAIGDGSYGYECLAPVFDAQGEFTFGSPCVYNGGSVVVLSK
jgi:hypothetical protein